MLPYEDDDHMEIGDSGWFPIQNGCYKNKYNGHTIDEMGKEYDKNGQLIYDPEEEWDF